MRFLLTAAMTLGLAMGAFANSNGEAKNESVKNADKAKRYYGYAESYKKQAKAALEQGKPAKAAALLSCAQAKLKMAQAYENGDKKLLSEGQAAYTKARAALKAASSGKKDPSKSQPKGKSPSPSDLQSKVKKQAEEIEQLKKELQKLKEKQK